MSTELRRHRTRAYAIRIVALVRSLPRDMVTGELAKQLLRSGCSVGANYRAACRARSQAEFIAKLGIVEEEADESLFWMDVLTADGVLPAASMAELVQEGNEILAMVVASIRTARG